MLYANDGKFGLGAIGFEVRVRSFWVLTFLDGTSSATVRVRGPGWVGYTERITTDRQFVQVVVPQNRLGNAVGFYIEIFSGDRVGGGRLPAWVSRIPFRAQIIFIYF